MCVAGASPLARLREGIAGLVDPASFHLSAREDLTQGTDLAFASVMSRPIVILATREGGRGCAKDAESDRHDQGRLSMLEHCLTSELLLHYVSQIVEGLDLFQKLVPKSFCA